MGRRKEPMVPLVPLVHWLDEQEKNFTVARDDALQADEMIRAALFTERIALIQTLRKQITVVG